MVVVLLPPLCPATTTSMIVPTRQGGHQRRRRRRGVVVGGTTTRMTTMMRIWTGGEGRGRGRGRERDGGTATNVCNMGNIHAYLLAMMTGGTMMRTFHHPGVGSWRGGRPLSCHGLILIGLLIVVVVVIVKGDGGVGRLTRRWRICGCFRWE